MISWLAATRKTSGICSAFAKPSSGVIGLKASSFPSRLLPGIKPGEGRGFLPCIYFFSPLLSPRRSRDIPRAGSSSPNRGGGRSWAPGTGRSWAPSRGWLHPAAHPHPLQQRSKTLGFCAQSRWQGNARELQPVPRFTAPSPGPVPASSGCSPRPQRAAGMPVSREGKGREAAGSSPSPPGYKLNGKA